MNIEAPKQFLAEARDLFYVHWDCLYYISSNCVQEEIFRHARALPFIVVSSVSRSVSRDNRLANGNVCVRERLTMGKHSSVCSMVLYEGHMLCTYVHTQ